MTFPIANGRPLQNSYLSVSYKRIALADGLSEEGALKWKCGPEIITGTLSGSLSSEDEQYLAEQQGPIEWTFDGRPYRFTAHLSPAHNEGTYIANLLGGDIDKQALEVHL